MKRKVILNWSGGKDSALSLFKILEESDMEVTCLLTSVSEEFQRVSMHGVRTGLLVEQAEKLGIPLVTMEVPARASMENYELKLRTSLGSLKKDGASIAAFGDIFLEDLREYREKILAEIGLSGYFPLWGEPTDRLVQDFIGLGFKAIVTCVDEKFLDKSFAGRVIDQDFIRDLPDHVDPCGENGEYHSFVFDGPIFNQPVFFERGDIVFRKYKMENSDSNLDGGFWYCDLLQPAPSNRAHQETTT